MLFGAHSDPAGGLLLGIVVFLAFLIMSSLPILVIWAICYDILNTFKGSPDNTQPPQDLS